MTRPFRLGFFSRALPPLAAFAALAGLLAYPAACREAAGKAAETVLTLLLPSLYPYFVLSSLFLSMGWAKALERPLAPVMRALFGLPGVCAGPFLLGLTGGYPIGAKSAAALYASGQCSKRQCIQLLTFCNNSGPAFLVGAVGAGIFGDTRAGLLLYFAHVLAAVAAGMLSRLFFKPEKGGKAETPAFSPPRFSAAFSAAAVQALSSVGTIAAFVLLFAVLTALLRACGALTLLTDALSALLTPFGASPALSQALVGGFFEITAGISALDAAAGGFCARMTAAALILGWGGVSVHAQVLALILPSKLPMKPCLAGKAIHALFCAALTRALCALFPLSPAAETAALPADAVFLPAGACIFGLCLLLLPICKFFRRSLGIRPQIRYNGCRKEE